MRLKHAFLFAFQIGLIPALTAQTQADLFDDSVVHEIRFTMNPADWQTLKDHIVLDTDYNVTNFQWKGAGSLTGSVTNLAIHARGHGSRDYRKPGLHVSFNTYVKTQTFLGLTDIDLKSNTEDGSLLHERLSMLVFRRMGIPASREVHARVYMNGDYIGLFNVVEAVDQDFLTRLFNENNGYLYQYVPSDWTGVLGFGWHFEYLGQDLTKYAITPPAFAPAPFNPKTHTNAPDTVSLQAFIATMNQASDDSFISSMAPFLDLKAWLKHIAVETYVGDDDCILGDAFGLNNFYLYRFQALANGQAPNPLFKFIAWDKDLAFSDWWPPPSTPDRPILQHADQNVLMRRLMAIPEYRNSYFESLTTVAMLAGGAGGWLEQEATREYQQIRQAAYDDANKLRLESGNHVPVSNDDFDAACAWVIGYAAHRTPSVMSQIAAQGYQLPANYPALSDGGFVSVGSHSLPVAAGGAAEIYGLNFGTPDTTSVYINGFLAPLLFTSGGQMDVQVPWKSTGSGTLGVVVNGAPSNIVSAPVSSVAPTILAVTHTDGATYVAPGNGARAGEVLVVYATGLGPVTGSMVDGQKAAASPLQSTALNTSVTIGGVPAAVSFSGLTPGFIGLYQINAQVPAGLTPGLQNISVSVGGAISPPMTVATQ